jgi:hypothetical protein
MHYLDFTEIAKEFLGTFTVEYILAYGVEYVKMKVEQIENEACEEAGIEKQLMYREVTSDAMLSSVCFFAKFEVLFLVLTF